MFHSLIPCLDYLQLLEEGELILESNSIHTKTCTVDKRQLWSESWFSEEKDERWIWEIIRSPNLAPRWTFTTITAMRSSQMLRFWDWGWPVHIDAIKWMLLNAATSTALPGKQCPWSFVHQMIGVQPGSLEITLQTKQRRRGSMLQLRFPIWPLMLTLWPPWLPVS